MRRELGPLNVAVVRDFDSLAQHPACFVLVVWRLVFGVEAGGSLRERTDLSSPWVWIYLGWWLVEFYWDWAWRENKGTA